MIQPENNIYFFALLGILPLVALVFVRLKWRSNTIKKMGESQLVTTLLRNTSLQKYLVKIMLALVAMAMLVVALVNYRKADSSQKIKLSGTDLMIALDVSNSMLAKDIQPNRLEKAKLLIAKLIDQLEGNRVGLVIFAGNAYLQMPLTTDVSAIKLFLTNISPALVPLQGTNISDALLLCDKSLNTDEKKYKSILLISDGEDHDETTTQTTTLLKDHGVVINTLGVGSPAGATLYDPITNQTKKDDQGNAVVSKLNETELRNIAQTANGVYQLLSQTDVAIATVTTQLKAMDKKAISDTSLVNFTSYYWIFLALTLLFLVMATLMAETKKKAYTPIR